MFGAPREEGLSFPVCSVPPFRVVGRKVSYILDKKKDFRKLSNCFKREKSNPVVPTSNSKMKLQIQKANNSQIFNQFLREYFVLFVNLVRN